MFDLSRALMPAVWSTGPDGLSHASLHDSSPLCSLPHSNPRSTAQDDRSRHTCPACMSAVDKANDGQMQAAINEASRIMSIKSDVPVYADVECALWRERSDGSITYLWNLVRVTPDGLRHIERTARCRSEVVMDYIFAHELRTHDPF